MYTEYDEVKASDVQIINFIFHVVHHGEETAGLMNSTPIGRFDKFFKDRIIEVLNGNKFNFENSAFLTHIEELDNSSQRFVDISKELAEKFHEIKDERIKAGVMILMKVNILDKIKYILIKYDHENVITYKQTGGDAVLEEISNTFSKSKDSLQKSAIIDISAPEPYVIVVDRTERQGVTKFFKTFLGIRRKYDNKTLTEKVEKAFLGIVKKHKDELTPDFTYNARTKYHNLVQNSDFFNLETFLPTIFGELYKPEMEKSFLRELKINDIQGEEFEFDKSINIPRPKKYRTIEGVTIHCPEMATDTIQIEVLDAKTIITIETKKLVEE